MKEPGTIKVARMKINKNDFVNSTPERRQKAYEYMVGTWLEELIKLKDYDRVKELQIRIILQGEDNNDDIKRKEN